MRDKTTAKSSQSSNMGYRTSGIVSLCLVLFALVMHLNYDVTIYMFSKAHQRIPITRLKTGKTDHPIYYVASRALPYGFNEVETEPAVSEGDVDVAVFSIRENYINRLPWTVSCPRWNRSITYRNARFNVSACKDADLVLFASGKDFRKLEYWSQLQSQRTVNQIWILSSPETAINTVRMWPPWEMRDIRMNLSSTFSLDSNIPIPYGEYIPFKEPRKIPFRSKLLNDSENFAVWIASHCPLRTWNRSGLVHELSRYIDIDMYGKCGSLVCDSRDKRCLSNIRSYKFYLALENSCCKNYITEKLWEPLKLYDLIPVVLGASREDYRRVAPPNSFIHIDDFKSLKHLADYLKIVASNLTLYRSYFEWKNHGYIKAQKNYKSIWESEKHSCELLEYVKGIRPIPSEGFDPFGPTWFSGCRACGSQPWLHHYYLNPSQTVYDNIQSVTNATLMNT